MSNRVRIIILLFIAIFIGQTIFAQKQKRSTRWRLGFEYEHPQRMVVTDPDGGKQVYWYVRYKIINNTQRDIPYAVNVKIIIDKTREGVPESKVPNLFYKAQIPSFVTDKLEYVNSLKTYYDTDFPIVKRKILSKLRIYPKLSKREQAILKVLTDKKAISTFQVMEKLKGKNPDKTLYYPEIEALLNNLTATNLVISQEIKGNPIFGGANSQQATFFIKTKEVKKKAGETIGGWKVVSFAEDSVTLEKNGTTHLVKVGSCVEYLYSKSGKNLYQRDSHHYSGMTAKGTFKGRLVDGGKKKYAFERAVIAKNSVRNGIAVFYNISPEMDFMAIVVSGLIDPIVRRYKVVKAHNEVLMIGYEHVDAFSITGGTLRPLYKRWIILSEKEVRKYE